MSQPNYPYCPTAAYHLGAGVAWVKRLTGQPWPHACAATLPAKLFDALDGGEPVAFAPFGPPGQEIIAMRIYDAAPDALAALDRAGARLP